MIVAVRSLAVTAIILAAITMIPGPVPADTHDDEYAKSIEEWYQGRIERLTSDTGDLTLAGLFPLDKGTNRFGSGASNHLVFPEKSPKSIGTIYYKNEKLEIAIMPGVKVTHDSKPVDKMYFQSDAGGEPTEFEMGSISFYVIERAGELYLRIKDTENALRMDFGHIERFPMDEGWRIEARFEVYDPPKPISVPNVLGYDTTIECPGVLIFELNGKEFRLEPMPAGEDSFFIVFGDETSGLETYGGGRFVYTATPDEDGKLIIDFNKAYNPPCAFTPYATCPLPRKANILALRVEAGEKAWGGSAH